MASPAAPGLGSILLHLDATPASALRLAVARELAERHRATVTALFGAGGEGGALCLFGRRGARRGAGRGARLGLACRRGRQPAARERPSSAPRGALVPRRGRLDRARLPRRGRLRRPARARPATARCPRWGAGRLVDSMILESGRPALVLPSGARAAVPGRRVLVAWNASPQSARALASARVLLAHAESVHVACGLDIPLRRPSAGSTSSSTSDAMASRRRCIARGMSRMSALRSPRW